MGYQIDELLRAVGTEGISEEEVLNLIKEAVTLQAKINKVTSSYRDAMMKREREMYPNTGLGATQGKIAY